jgi:transglutaminase-like putative cysteine protease
MTAGLPKKGDFKMKKSLTGLFAMALACLIFLNMNAIFAKSDVYIEKNGVSLVKPPAEVQGKVHISGSTSKEKIKIMVKKDDSQTWYDVPLVDGNFDSQLWLVQGEGSYTITVMVHEYDRKYSYGPSVTVKNTLDVDRFSVPTKEIESDAPEITSLAEKLAENKKTDAEKMKAIYDWVTANINYDYKKYEKHLNGDYDNTYGALNTLKTKKGVCYDYAALTAALGRASGVRVKVVKGEGKLGAFQGLHAWNEFYSSEEKRWVSMDTTFGALGQDVYFDNRDFDDTHRKIDEY